MEIVNGESAANALHVMHYATKRDRKTRNDDLKSNNEIMKKEKWGE